MRGNLPEIAIIGRPNVGKSSLFNALIKKRRSIVDEMPGITRDRIHEKTLLNNRYPVYFIDTGGISKREKHLFIEEITESAKKSIQEADLLLFVVEFSGLTQDDQELASYLRKNAAGKTVLIVNKVDNEERQLLANEYYSLGFHDVFFTSAAHMKGIQDLSEGIIGVLEKKSMKPEPVEIPAENNEIKTDEYDFEPPKKGEPLKITLIGRPNVGKSSLMNLILGNERSIVSDIPGTTRDLIEEEFSYYGKKLILVDTAGIRRKTKIKEKIEYVSIKKSMEAMDRADIVVLLLDSVESITDQDKKLLGLALDKYQKGLIIAVNKWDLIRDEVKKSEYIERIRFLLRAAHFIPVVPISVKENYNIRELFKVIYSMEDRLLSKISTKELTDFLREQVKEHPLYNKEGAFKVFYASQIGYKPPLFKITINHKELVTEAYVKFLQNTIRSKFKLEGIPIQIDLVERKRQKK